MNKKNPDCVYTRETNGFGTARPFLSDVSKWQRALLLGLAVTINTECKDGQNEWRQLPSTCLVSYINGLIYSGCNNIPQPEWFLQLSKLAPRSVTQRRFSREKKVDEPMSPAKGCSSRERHCPRILPPSPRQGQKESHIQADLWESSFLTQPLPTMSILNRLLLNNIFIFIQSQWPGEEELSVILGFEHDGS